MAEKTKRPQSDPQERHLRAVPDIKRPNYTRRRVGAAVLLTLLSAGSFLGVKAGAESVASRARAAGEAEANASPEPGDICVIEAEGYKPGEFSTKVLGDEFADGTGDIQRIAHDAGVVAHAHPGDGVAICRNPESTKLNDNYVAAPENVEPEQIVSEEEFDEAGGVSHDVTLGR